MSRSRRRSGHDGGGGGHDAAGMGRWLLTYSDMITLLLALFVILFALSSINARKFLAFKLGLTESFSQQVVQPHHSGLLPKANSAAAAPSQQLASAAPPTSTPSPTLTQIAQEVRQALAAAGLSQYTSVTIDHQGVVVEMLSDKAYFATDSATLGPIGDAVVDTIATVLRTIPNNVEVQGYTDNTPIASGPYPSNWVLSAVRAVNVVERLVTHDKITANRLAAVGYGTTHPVVPNTTPANKAENRRVDVVILTTSIPTPTVVAPAP